MCEDLTYCLQHEYQTLQKIAFSIMDINNDESLCDVDVIEFDKTFCQSQTWFSQCSSDLD